MGHESWIAVEPAVDGDQATVVETFSEWQGAIDGRDTTDGTLQFAGFGPPASNIERLIESVGDHLQRAVFVVEHDGGIGSTVGRYYEREDGKLRRIEELRHEFRHDPAEHFDYFAARYGIHGVV
ncbi:hypothetical protein BVU17_17865 (plasmid) [Haloarcula taiwanensis]|uniref:Uncharacterized protein n=1 Tax=Haloarcula taiwanensis TaxID=1932004 RepID=A0A2H5A442_9EURY|nr:hypothetical protein [Haloarcula taiwanensis]AUG49447.1 hypothetical protein BVU17_17865 [Haloarcula taiwanensis]